MARADLTKGWTENGNLTVLNVSLLPVEEEAQVVLEQKASFLIGEKMVRTI